MPESDLDVYDYFHPPHGRKSAVDGLAFAIYMRNKRDWMHHVERERKSPPTPDEIANWTSNLTKLNLESLRIEAVDFFDVAAKAYAAPKRTFWLNVAASIVATILLAVVGIVIAVIVQRDPFLSGIVRQILDLK